MSSLSIAHCTLLAVHYASENNIRSLSSLFALRQDSLNSEILLRIILMYIPESTDPSDYVDLVQSVASRLPPQSENHANLDISAVKDLSDSQARKRARKLYLLPLCHPSYPEDGPSDLIAQFIYHRAHHIEEDAGLLALVPQLVLPFLGRSEFLRTWFISSVLPLLRIGYEYYPPSTSTPSLQSFENLERAKGVNVLMSKAMETDNKTKSATERVRTAGRDLRGVVAPWMYGDGARKRRKINNEAESASSPVMDRIRRGSNDVSPQENHAMKYGWEYAFRWMVDTATENFALVTEAVEDWDGPSDVDFGGYDDGKPYLEERVQEELLEEYGQAALASVYVVNDSTPEAIDGAHGILVRLADLFSFDPPPDLTTNVEVLPKLNQQPPCLDGTSDLILQPEHLLHKGHPLTTLRSETFMLLQTFVYSARQLAELGLPISIFNVVDLYFNGLAEEQLGMFRRIMHDLTNGPRKDDQQWYKVRSNMLWLWDWGISSEGAEQGAGLFGKIQRVTIDKELLRAFISGSCYDLAIKIFLPELLPNGRLGKEEAEEVIIASALQSYDNASNGNRTRGGMKKASDIVSAFHPSFAASNAFKRLDCLLAATHALSFYSLTLQHGVPFQPVSIRVSSDPITLIQKVLEQNPRSYTKLDDLISIAQNLVAAGLTQGRDLQDNVDPAEVSQAELNHKKAEAESRVIGMAVDASLAADDFETAYSYIVNRSQPPDPSSSFSFPDTNSGTTAWRSAVAAGKYHSNTLSTSAAILRRLDQRMDLLSRALFLAPPSALSEILNAWRRVEEEMSAQQAREDEAEDAWNDKGDRLQSKSPLPGTFMDTRTMGMEFGQPTREIGRPRGRRGEEEAPMGLFDVARGAAAAFNRTAFPLRGTRVNAAGKGSIQKSPTEAISPDWSGSDLGSPTAGSGDEGRVRKRDMAYNAATGALASGLGWVLGATPVDQQARTPSRG